MQKITPFIWFDNNLAEALKFYTSVFKDSKVVNSGHVGEEGLNPGGKIFTATFQLNGVEFMGINGGPAYKPTEGVSFFIKCSNQEEVDYYWNHLTSGGGQEQPCGWLKDKFGVSWQVVPDCLGDFMSSADRVSSNRAIQAMLQMKKLDIQKLQDAFDGK